MALTPVAVLMFKFNNPDAFARAVARRVGLRLHACVKRRVRWLLAVGALIGFGFLTKMLQAPSLFRSSRPSI